MNSRQLLIAWLGIVLGFTACPVPATGAQLEPFFARWCTDCHGGERPEAGMRLDVTPRAPAQIARARERLLRHEMPPKIAPQPPPPEVSAAIQLIERELEAASHASRRPRLRRLSRTQYENTVRDLLQVEFDARQHLPQDDLGNGFDVMADVLTISPLQLEKYLAAAELIAARAIVPDEDRRAIEQRTDARRMRCSLDESIRDRTWRVLYSNGSVSTGFVAPRNGDYELCVRACGDQAGDEPVRMAIEVDGRVAVTLDVTATTTAPQAYQTRLVLERGKHAIAVAFANDFYEPEAPDPERRDRNLLIDWVSVVGPTDAQPLPVAQVALLAHDPGGDDPSARARAVLQPLVRRAWRRDASDAELARLGAIVAAAVADHQSFARGLQLALRAILVAPSFLYLDQGDGDHALATWLSYFLWSSMPDEPLLALADRGRLHEPSVLRGEVTRMLADARAWALSESFAAQWLEVKNLVEAAPDPARFPAFDDELRAAMQEETLRLFDAVLREHRSVFDLLDPDFTFANERLAQHYGITGVRGAQMRRVKLGDRRRGGLLAHASVLTVTSNPTRTSPVKRGKWILEHILDAPPPPPPPEAGVLLETGAAVATQSMRERLTAHRRDPSCASCHARMDPLGFALECFDATGVLHDGADTRAVLADGRSVSGPLELKDAIGHAHSFVRALARQLLTYACGCAADEWTVVRIVASVGDDPTLAEVITAVVLIESESRASR